MLCPKCGRTSSCDKPSCPLKARELFAKSTNFSYKKDFAGTTPNVFVGHFGYPNINVGLLSTDFSPENFDFYHDVAKDDIDNPLKWSKETYDINKIVNLRTTLINSRFRSKINSPTSVVKNKLSELSKEISLSPRNVDTEISLKEKPMLRMSFNAEASPHGPSSYLLNAHVTENVRVPTKVDKIVSDIDYKAGSALNELYKHNFDEHYLTKILSVGNLGIKTQRKLVPTRWSITAVDDSLGKNIVEEVKKNSNNTGYLAYYGGYLENYFLVLFFPGEWNYEFFETFSFDMESKYPGLNVKSESDYEGYNGRKEYATETAGGYYASRLPVIEHLKSLKRQGSVLVMRFITKDYFASLGVWVVRESVKKTLSQRPLEFGSEDLIITYAKKLILKKFKFDISGLLKKSKLIELRKNQKKLQDYCK